MDIENWIQNKSFGVREGLDTEKAQADIAIAYMAKKVHEKKAQRAAKRERNQPSKTSKKVGKSTNSNSNLNLKKVQQPPKKKFKKGHQSSKKANMLSQIQAMQMKLDSGAEKGLLEKAIAETDAVMPTS